MKHDILAKLKAGGVVAVVRGKSVADAVAISKAAVGGGITAIELTFTTPAAQVAVAQLAEAYASSPNVVIGAGTVLDAITARIAILNGAKFIVSPGFDREVAMQCNLYSVPYFPGCVSSTEVIEAMKYGCEVIKLFPGGLLKPAHIKDLHGPIPNAEFIPSGGVDEDNVGEWVKKGAWAVSAGSSLSKDVKEKGYASVSERAKAFVAKYRQALAK